MSSIIILLWIAAELISNYLRQAALKASGLAFNDQLHVFVTAYKIAISAPEKGHDIAADLTDRKLFLYGHLSPPLLPSDTF